MHDKEHQGLQKQVFLLWAISQDGNQVIAAFCEKKRANNTAHRLNTNTYVDEDSTIACAATILDCSFSVSTLTLK